LIEHSDHEKGQGKKNDRKDDDLSAFDFHRDTMVPAARFSKGGMVVKGEFDEVRSREYPAAL
jgi:hypothetical protein